MKTWHQYQHRWLVVGCTPEEKASQLVGVRSGYPSSVSVVRSSTVTCGVPELCREVVQACVSFVFVQRTQGFEVFRDRVSIVSVGVSLCWCSFLDLAVRFAWDD